jgi:hypothetical protein
MSINDAESNLRMFYGGKMTDPEAVTFLKRRNIAYVFYSETEQTYAPAIHALNYPFLTERYNKNGTIIYQVQ